MRDTEHLLIGGAEDEGSKCEGVNWRLITPAVVFLLAQEHRQHSIETAV